MARQTFLFMEKEATGLALPLVACWRQGFILACALTDQSTIDGGWEISALNSVGRLW